MFITDVCNCIARAEVDDDGFIDFEVIVVDFECPYHDATTED